MMKNIRNLLKKLHRDEKGATAIEYGLIAALISVAIIAGATALGSKLSATFNQLSDTMSSATTAANTSTTKIP